MATAPPVDNPIIVNLYDTYGCLLVGLFLSCIVWGATSVQVFLYFANYWDQDKWWRKALVICLYVVDTVNEILVLMSIWPKLIANFGSIAGLSVLSPELIHHGWIAGLVEITVQLYFIHRIWKFSNKGWFFNVLSAGMVILSVYQLFVLIPYDILTFGQTGASIDIIAIQKANDITISLRAVTATEDILIAAAMIYLVTSRGMPEYRGTQRMMYRLIWLTLNTGFWTAIFALVELVLVAHYPNGLQFMVMEGPLCGLYLNAFLASLNARNYITGRSQTSVVEWNETPSRRIGNGSRSGASNGPFILQALKRSVGSTSSTLPATTITAHVDHSQASAVDYKIERDIPDNTESPPKTPAFSVV